MKTLTAERLRELLHYDPETGVFTRRIPCGGKDGNKFKPGSVVGSRTALGYLETQLDGARGLMHRLAVLYMTGRWPVDQVDHLNGLRADNRWLNLREVDNRTNIENRRRPNKNNRSGWLGCHQDKGRWAAQITVNRKRVGLGRFATPQEAHAAYLAAKRRLHQGCTL